MAKINSIFKIVFFSLSILFIITYLTVEPPKKIDTNDIDISNLPKTVELIGFEETLFNTNSIIKNNSILFVSNFESIAIAKQFVERVKSLKQDVVVVSNISDAPWFLKNFKTKDKTLQIKGDKDTTPWIYDKDGAIRYFLKLKSADPLKFFVFQVQNNKVIKIETSSVKQGTIDGKMTEEEISKLIEPIIKKLKI